MPDFGLELIDAAIAAGGTLTIHVMDEGWSIGMTRARLVMPNGSIVGSYGETQELALLELVAVLAAESPG